MKIKFSYVSLKISLFFMMLLTVTVLLISFIFVIAINFSIQAKQADILRTSLNNVQKVFLEEVDQDEPYFEVPFNVSFIIFKDENEVLYSNDIFLPFLEDTNDKAKKYFVKDYFSDGNLNIRYVSKTFKNEQSDITIITAIDIDNDYESEFFVIFPKLILTAIFPILLLSFVIAVYITRKITAPYERERQFSNDVSHELKTPLAVINGYVSLLLRWGKNDADLLEESLTAIKKETISMQSIIENLSQINRYESGILKPSFNEFAAEEFLQRLKAETETLCKTDKDENSDKVQLEVDLKQNLSVFSDEEMLHQIMTIFISNSLKYNSNKCKIILRAWKKGKTIVFEEEDDGIGIDEKIMPYIFNRFYRGDSSHSQTIPGYGLGLFIAKSLTTSLEGKITVRKAPASGVVFRIELKSKK